ncbi:hypothetical protein [Xanthomonas phage RTH11]|nr:hypothetical protein [Xanthomonas phage RTH11]
MNTDIKYNPQDICSLLNSYWTLRFQMHVLEPFTVSATYGLSGTGYTPRPVGLTIITNAPGWRTSFSDNGMIKPIGYDLMAAIAVVPGTDGSLLSVELFDTGASHSLLMTLLKAGHYVDNRRLFLDGSDTTWDQLDLQLYGPWLTAEVTRLLELRSSQHQAFQKVGLQGKSESLHLTRLIHDYVLLRQSLEPRFEIPKIRTVEVNILDPGLFRYGDPVESGQEVERETYLDTPDSNGGVVVDTDTSKHDQLVYQIPQASNWHDATENEEPIVLTVFVSGAIDGRVCELSTLGLEGSNRNNARLFLGDTPVQWSELGALKGFIQSVEGDLEHWQAIADANKPEPVVARPANALATELRELADLLDAHGTPSVEAEKMIRSVVDYGKSVITQLVQK